MEVFDLAFDLRDGFDEYLDSLDVHHQIINVILYDKFLGLFYTLLEEDVIAEVFSCFFF